jgi:ABC-type bacteriocin/lantibiotic exporter with double-glycine peptidase domain
MKQRCRSLPGILVLYAAIVAAPASEAAPPVISDVAIATETHLSVPLIQQERERCGPAALEMVLRYYGAGAEAIEGAQRTYDPVLRGALITDLAAAARRAGFEASIGTLTPDSLIALVESGVPPIVLYQSGTGPVTVPHYAVVTGWDIGRAAFILNDGEDHSRYVGRDDLARRWRKAGSQALVVRQIPR